MLKYLPRFIRKIMVARAKKEVFESFAAINEDIEFVLREHKEPENPKNKKHYRLSYVLVDMSVDLCGDKIPLKDFGISGEDAIKLFHKENVTTAIIMIDRCKNGDYSGWCWYPLEKFLEPYGGPVSLEEAGISIEELNTLRDKYEEHTAKSIYDYWSSLEEWDDGMLFGPSIHEYERERRETTRELASFFRDRKISRERIKEIFEKVYADEVFIASVNSYL